MNIRHFLFASVCLFFAASCSDDGPTDYLVTIETPEGDMHAILYDETPLHKANFIKLAKAGFYNDQHFYRIIREFMIQGGDPKQSDLSKEEIGSRDTVTYTIPAEIRPQFFHERGTLAAARQGDEINPDRASSGSQFYIVQGKVWPDAELNQFRYDQQAMFSGMDTLLRLPENKWLLDSIRRTYESGNVQAYNELVFAQASRVEQFTGKNVLRDLPAERVKVYTTTGGAPHLDDTYTVFGKILDGFDVLEKLSQVQTGPGDKPLEPLPMTVSVKEMSRKRISAKYGFTYPAEPAAKP